MTYGGDGEEALYIKHQTGRTQPRQLGKIGRKWRTHNFRDMRHRIREMQSDTRTWHDEMGLAGLGLESPLSYLVFANMRERLLLFRMQLPFRELHILT